ncbi:MAG: glycosyltransferase [Caldilineaceae bacterium]|nr:glycosyltransferase [Caldilineaceae bacterium]MDE0336290.1 glycosyltransferase [Caldilineaceae bacterium]
MKVLLLYKDYYPVLGGIENHISLLARGLRQKGVDASVLVTNTGKDTSRQAIDGVPVIKTGRQAHFLSTPISLPFFAELRRQLADVDLVHLHAPYPPAEFAQLLLGRSKPAVITYHSDIVRQRRTGKLYAPLLRKVLQRAALVAVSSPAYIESSPFLQDIRKKCRVVHFGIELERFAETGQVRDDAQRLRTQYNDLPLLLFIGRLRHYKGVDVLIRAMHRIRAKLLIVGTGPMQEAWQSLAQTEDLAGKVFFLGDASERECLAARYAADLFVLPSTNRAEALGIVQLEAMACGMPVVCTELGTGTSYVNRNGVTGLVVAPSDPQALAAAINRLLVSPALRAKMGSEGRRRVREEFSYQSMIDATICFYQEALNAG